MYKKTCKKCSKVIEGYGKRHVDFLMEQHMQGHARREKNKLIKEFVK